MASYTIRLFPHKLWGMLIYGSSLQKERTGAAGFRQNVQTMPFLHGRKMQMKITIEPTLFTDPQAAVPAGFCEVCGREIYAPSLICARCERRGKS